jgi:C-terminal processing protease CtpA/Prc
MYYDHSGGAIFQPRDFFHTWRTWLETSRGSLQDRQGVETGLRFLTSQLQDPYSRYLTRDELERERAGTAAGSAGFLRLGVMVEAPSDQTFFRSSLGSPVLSDIPPALLAKTSSPSRSTAGTGPHLLSARQVQSLPVAMAVRPHSPAERMGLTVGDRVVAVGPESFLGKDAQVVLNHWNDREPQQEDGQNNPLEMTIAKPVYVATSRNDRDVIVAYRPQRLRLPTAEELDVHRNKDKPSPVRFDLLQGRQSSLFSDTRQKVGYIRMMGFSKSATTAFVEAVNKLEKMGADAYIIDLRNNYGGVIQEAMLTAASILRDPHAVLCYTLNAGGGFAPHDVEEYVLHERYPGYLLSTEPRSATSNQVKRESPEVFNGKGEWSPPSSYASLREQRVKRGIHPASLVAATAKDETSWKRVPRQKSLVLLVNEGTASSAEVFASALRDNGRAVAIVGTKTFGKG